MAGGGTDTQARQICFDRQTCRLASMQTCTHATYACMHAFRTAKQPRQASQGESSRVEAELHSIQSKLF